MRKKAFTLIELLVVISIISLLASLVVTQLGSARLKARDAKRKSDLAQIGKALNLYFDNANSRPAYNSTCSDVNPPNLDGWAVSNPYPGCNSKTWLTTDANFQTFLPNMPVDPVNSGHNAGWGTGQYVYSYYQSANNEYELVAQLENATDTAACSHTPALYHNVTPFVSWCANGGNLNIYSDH